MFILCKIEGGDSPVDRERSGNVLYKRYINATKFGLEGLADCSGHTSLVTVATVYLAERSENIITLQHVII